MTQGVRSVRCGVGVALAAWALRPAGAGADSLRAIASWRDVVVISGTASGKKVLIYQLPASDDWFARHARGRAPRDPRG